MPIETVPHNTRMQAVLVGAEELITQVYGGGRRAKIENETSLYPHVVNTENWMEHAAALQEAQVAFGTWGIDSELGARLSQLPHLKALFYAAGSVRAFAEPLLERGIAVHSGWAANAVPVAEFTFAQILLANKGYFRNTRDFTAPEMREQAFYGCGNFEATVSLLGAGMIARLLIERLKTCNLNVLVFDPFLTTQAAAELGVEKVELFDAFARGDVTSNHLANVPATVKLLHAEHFRAMPRNAVFINTGRGATVHEADLVDVLRERPDVTALLDVTEPEPPLADSPFYTLPNVQLSTHIAGAIGDERLRIADWVFEEFLAWRAGEPTRFAITTQMLEQLA